MNVNIKTAKNRLSELVTLAEAGETIVLTRHGKEVATINPVPPKPRNEKFDRWKALDEYKKKHGIPTDNLPHFDLEEFNRPLPEDFLITPITFPDEK